MYLRIQIVITITILLITGCTAIKGMRVVGNNSWKDCEVGKFVPSFMLDVTF